MVEFTQRKHWDGTTKGETLDSARLSIQPPIAGFLVNCSRREWIYRLEGGWKSAWTVILKGQWWEVWRSTGGWLLRLILFHFFINNQADRMECAHRKSIDGTKLKYVTCWRQGLPLRTTSTGWRKWQTETRWSPTKTNAETCMWDRINPCLGTGWNSLAEKLLCRKGLRCSGGK